MEAETLVQSQYGPPAPEAAATIAFDLEQREIALQEIWQLVTNASLDWAIWPNGH